ncbi:MAG: nucleoside-diphosphate kinase, partial [Egibacteraceae bacterium]
MTFWSRHAFVLLSPDTLRRGLQTAVVERLAREGFAPVAGRVVQADPEMIDDLYADVIAGQWQTWRYRLVDDLFSSGPCLALLCRFDREGGHAALARRKGHQHPHLAEPGTIRSDFRAVNSILGLIHSADGPEESRREAAVFGLSEQDATGGDALALMCALSGSALPERRGFDDVLAGVRGRVLLAALHDLPAGLADRLRT